MVLTENFKYTAGCLMLDTPISGWERLLQEIKPEDLYQPDQGYGLEDNPHVTVLYGIDSKVPLGSIIDYISSWSPVKLTLTKLSFFQSANYDVLKFDVSSPQLRVRNSMLRRKFPYENSYPDYCPHMTVAYLQPGMAKKYLHLAFNTGVEYVFDVWRYSCPHHKLILQGMPYKN